MFILVCIILVLFPEEAQTGAREGLKMTFETLAVSIVPFAAAASGMVYSGAAEKISRIFFHVFKFLHLNPMGAGAYIMSLLGGYPTGCKAVCDMYREGSISKSEAERMLSYTNNGGLIFALNVCGEKCFGERISGIIIFAAASLSAIIAGCILGRSNETGVGKTKKEKLSAGAVFGKSIISAGNVFVNITASFVVFYALIYALGINKMPILSGFCELTGGIIYSGKIKSLSLAAFFFSLGGLAVMAQCSALCAESGIKLKKCFYGKVLSAVIAFLITYLFEKSVRLGKDVLFFTTVAIIAVLAAIKMLRALRRA